MANVQPVTQQYPYTAFNLVPLPANAVPLGGQFVPNAAPCKPNSLSRLGELQKFLVQCDDPAYFGNYYQLLNTATPDTLQDALRSLKERSQWLEEQQNIEFTRMRSLNILPLAVRNALNKIMQPTTGVPSSAAGQHRNTPSNIVNHKNGSETPEIAAVASLPTAELAAAVEHHQLIRDSATPPILESNEPETKENVTKGGKKGPAKKAQGKLKRKRT